MMKHVLIGATLGTLAWLIAGCAPTVYRLGPHESLVLDSREQVIAVTPAGVQRVWK